MVKGLFVLNVWRADIEIRAYAEVDMLATQTKTTAISLSTQDRMITTVIAALLGSFLIFGVALAQPSVLHNAAHDTRHAMTFPCH